MPYYLHHYFIPDFSHTALKPVTLPDGNIIPRYLGYVQNVVAGQVLAELIQISEEEATDARCNDPVDFFQDLLGVHPALEQTRESLSEEALSDRQNANASSFLSKATELSFEGARNLDARFIYNQPVFPLGPNCIRDPGAPNLILAQESGYCFYHQGLITVKKLLNVRQDINFSTGNILFIGDTVVHGNVYPGFSLLGRDILIKGRVDGGTVKARGALTLEQGVKGSPRAYLEAGGSIRMKFCEHSTVRAGGNVIIEGNCLHSNLYVSGSVVIKGRLQGGRIHAGGIVYVEDQIGDAQGAITRILLGYDPRDLLQLQEIQEDARLLADKIGGYERTARRGKLFAAEVAPHLELARRKLDILQAKRRKIRQGMAVDHDRTSRNRLIVPGTVYPGTEINIGKAYFKSVVRYCNCAFLLRNEEIDFITPALPAAYGQKRKKEISGKAPCQGESPLEKSAADTCRILEEACISPPPEASRMDGPQGDAPALRIPPRFSGSGLDDDDDSAEEKP